MSKSVVGQKGWIFLDNDSNNVIEHHLGLLNIDQTILDLWDEEMTNRKMFFEKNNMNYIPVVVPNKHIVYSEFLPLKYKLNSNRSTSAVVNILKEKFNNLVYPLNDFLNSKKKGFVYGQTDSHWSDLGAYICYENICNVLGVKGIDFKSLKITTEKEQGDLGCMFNPELSGWNTKIEFKEKFAQLNFNNRIENNGNFRVFVSDKTKKTSYSSCVIFGNSFVSTFFLKLLTTIFNKVIFSFSPNLDYELIKDVRPNFVIHQMVERFLVKCPRDIKNISGIEMSALKFLNFPLEKQEIIFSSISKAYNGSRPEFLILKMVYLITVKNNYQEAESIFKQSKGSFYFNSICFIWSILLVDLFEKIKGFTQIRELVNIDKCRDYDKKFVKYFLDKKRFDIVKDFILT